ncbi:hypothetical protein D3C84_1032000 [compost metagenome]
MVSYEAQEFTRIHLPTFVDVSSDVLHHLLSRLQDVFRRSRATQLHTFDLQLILFVNVTFPHGHEGEVVLSKVSQSKHREGVLVLHCQTEELRTFHADVS